MKMKLNKRKLLDFTADRKVLPGAMTPEVAGGRYTNHPILCLPELTDEHKGCPTYGF
jgi:hypothetical protein